MRNYYRASRRFLLLAHNVEGLGEVKHRSEIIFNHKYKYK